MAKKPNLPPPQNPDAVLVDKLLKDLQGPDDKPKTTGRPSGQIRGPLVGKAHFSDPVASPREPHAQGLHHRLGSTIGVACEHLDHGERKIRVQLRVLQVLRDDAANTSDLNDSKLAVQRFAPPQRMGFGYSLRRGILVLRDSFFEALGVDFRDTA